MCELFALLKSDIDEHALIAWIKVGDKIVVPSVWILSAMFKVSSDVQVPGMKRKTYKQLLPGNVFIKPEFIEIENWEKDIDTSKEKILLYDNNFLASSDKHFNSVIDKLKKLKMKVDFNQGLDCRLLTDERARRLAEIKIDPVRFAFDGLHQDNYIHKAIITMKSSEHSTNNKVEKAVSTPIFFKVTSSNVSLIFDTLTT